MPFMMILWAHDTLTDTFVRHRRECKAQRWNTAYRETQHAIRDMENTSLSKRPGENFVRPRYRHVGGEMIHYIASTSVHPEFGGS